MNSTFTSAGRQILLDLLYQCTEPQQLIFKRMYSHLNLEATIEEAVQNMDDAKIDWAITQCEKTVEKNHAKSLS